MRRLALPALLAVVLSGMVLETNAAEPIPGEPVIRRGSVEGRAYRLYVPTAVAGAAGEAPPRPLVVALHGCWQTPEDFVTTTRLGRAAERRGVLVVAPAQGKRDHPSRCWNWSAPEHQSRMRGELAQILAIVAAVRQEFRVERDRVIVLGFSAGGYMAVNLACAAPDVVFAIGVASGGPYRCGDGPIGAVDCMRGLGLDGDASAAACRGAMGPRVRALRASLWHGGEDPVVSAANLKALSVMFARLHGTIGPTLEPGGPATYRDQSGRAVIQSWLVEGMGHAWSGGDRRGTHAFPPGPDATNAMLDFLLAPE